MELVVIRHLYDRPLDTIVATWGLSLIATQGTLIMVGSTMAGVGTPFGSFQVGDVLLFDLSHRAVLRSALGVLGGLYALFNWTRFGVLARATIQVPHMAAALGVDTRLDLQPHLCLRCRARRPCRRPVRADHDAGADHGRDLHHGGLRHRGDRWGRRLPRHGAGRRRCSRW